MRTLGLSLAALLLPSLASAQLQSARAVISDEASRPLPGIPMDGLWGRQFFVGGEREYLDVVEFNRVRWMEDERAYVGFLGVAHTRALPLSETRLLFESDHGSEPTKELMVSDWTGGALVVYELETANGSALARHLEDVGRGFSGGVQVRDGVAHGSREGLLEGLRTFGFERKDIERRWRRPTHAEMGFVWSFFELQEWANLRERHLKQIERELANLWQLGELHVVHQVLREIADSGCDRLDFTSFSPFDYSRWRPHRLGSLVERADQQLEKLTKMLDARMADVAARAVVLERSPDDERGQRPRPGQLVRFHVRVTRLDGTVLDDTRKRGAPHQAVLAESMPEGLQYALRTMRVEQTLRLRLPPDLAFGPPHGEVEVELELLEVLPERGGPPSFDREGLMGNRLRSVDANETPTRLRLRDVVTGEGPLATRGQILHVRLASWNATGDVLDAPYTTTVKFGDETVLDGLNEGLAGMRAGGQRILYLPRQLAYERPARAGMGVRIAVELLRIEE